MFQHYEQVRDLFAESAHDFRHPFTHRFPLTQALSFWRAQRTHQPHPPLLLEGHEALPLALQCELALIWAAIGSEAARSAAARLAARLGPLVEAGITTLWTPENARVATPVFQLFLRALGHDVPLAGELSPFFALLDGLRFESASASTDGYTLFSQGDAACAFAEVGEATSLGAMRFGKLQIPAFGIQAAPFSDAGLFGCDLQGTWARASASKETWLQVEPKLFGFSLQSVGLLGTTPLSLAWYVEASECRIGGQVLKPRSLARFRGQAKSAELIQGDSRITIETDRPLTVEAIPLAGGPGFWGASFLLAFQLPPLAGKLAFQTC